MPIRPEVDLARVELASAYRSPATSTCVSSRSFCLARSSADWRPLTSQPC